MLLTFLFVGPKIMVSAGRLNLTKKELKIYSSVRGRANVVCENSGIKDV